MGKFTVCAHRCEVNACPVVDCPHHDSRPELQKVFGPFPNSTFAASLAKSDPQKYAELRRQAVAEGKIAPTLADRRRALHGE